ncbi:amidase signature enzyme [Mytilinidion resinicola]|uniref:Amidase signature enzyme n=1 Tax=Mytilinidion resinicola TaxID=574789 RepID=A0A6A6YK39_9PEZI|nr:amidase signature enzyme [Mytilinidion resinicola]KAF2808928.1 amidase signature enzyme [Mytilinidion resinicola]
MALKNVGIAETMKFTRLVVLFTLFWGFGIASPIKVLLTNYDGSIAYSLGSSTRPYYIPSPGKSAAVGNYSIGQGGGNWEPEFVPFTVLVLNATIITGSVIEDTLKEYKEDDVYTVDFLVGLQIISLIKHAKLDESGITYLKSLSLPYLLIDSQLSCGASIGNSIKNARIIPPGPYVGKIHSGTLSLFKTYGTFYDQYDAFMAGVTPNDDGSYAYARIWHPEHYEIMIPYPSKLYTSLLDPAQYPLAGRRFGIKDIIDLEGIITGGGSREYARLYNTPKNETAPAMAKLIALGAVPVGKTKSATFAWGAWRDQNDDIPYSWNPRADGYLGLSASSYGSAAAIAAYPELDFTTGTDTLGSVRNPADRAGVYGLRTTWRAVEVEGIITSAITLDSVGFLTRDPILAQAIANVWEGQGNAALAPGPFTYPKKIIYPIEWFPVNSSAAQTLIDTWIANVTNALGMTIEYQNTSQIFQEVIGYNGTMGDWTTNVSSLDIYDNWATMGRQFVEDYGKAFGGRYPELDVSVRTPWAESPTYTKEYYDENTERAWEFTDFINNHVITGNNDTCSDGLWIYQIADTGGGVPEYRDRTLDYFPDFAGAMRGASIAPFAHTTDITVPIGQIPYMSEISHVEEQLAITLNFVAHRGCDLALMEFIKACADAGFCAEVKTGRTAF